MRGFAVSATLAVVVAVPQALAADEAPDTTYACEVRTEAGIAGLTFVQTQNLDTAKSMAVKTSARTLNGLDSPATEVVECIVSGKGEFRDSTVQNFYKRYPR